MNRHVNDFERREFLKRAAQTAAVGVIAPNLADGAVPKDKQIKLTDKIPEKMRMNDP